MQPLLPTGAEVGSVEHQRTWMELLIVARTSHGSLENNTKVIKMSLFFNQSGNSFCQKVTQMGPGCVCACETKD